MTHIGWSSIHLVSRLLERDDRDAVLGDFAESGLSAPAALRDVLGLIARRQAALWRTWGPWLALLGIVAPVSLMLFHFLLHLGRTFDLYFWIIGNYRHFDPAMLDQTGLTVSHGITVMIRLSFLMFVWSWTAGFVLGTLSRRAILVNGILFCAAGALLSVIALGTVPPPKPLLFFSLFTVLIVFPVVWGVREGLRRGILNSTPAILVAIAVGLATAVSIWVGGWWRGGAWNNGQLVVSLFLCWPAGYIVAAANRERSGGGKRNAACPTAPTKETS